MKMLTSLSMTLRWTEELNDERTIQIIRRGSLVQRQAPQQEARPPTGHYNSDKMPSPIVRASKTLATPAQGKVCAPFHTKMYLRLAIQPEFNLFESHQLNYTSWISKIEPDKTFWLLIANIAKESHQDLKDQVVATTFANPTRIAANMFTT